MDNGEKDIDDLFKDRFTENETVVSDRVWDNIKKTLPKESNETRSSGNIKLLFSILALLTLSALSFFYFTKINSLTAKKEITVEQNNDIQYLK